MLSDIRIRVGVVVMMAVITVLGAAQVHAAAPNGVRYVCDARQNLVIRRDAATATVQFIDRSYALHRKASGIGVRYVSPKATLIIDGPSAIFVAEDRLQLGACTETRDVASQP